MRFDPKRRLYLNDDGKIISPATIRKWVNDFILQEQKVVKKSAEQLISLTFDVAEFFEFMREKVAGWHSVSGVIAYGGEAQMNVERWARINQKVSSELEYLAGFRQEAEASFQAVERIAGQIASAYPDAQAAIRQSVSRALASASPAEAEMLARRATIEILGADVVIASIGDTQDLIGGQIVNRSTMYPESMYATFENNVMAREFDGGVRTGRRDSEGDGNVCDGCVAAATPEGEYVPLDELEEIGTQECGTRCRCEFSFGDQESSFRTSEIFSGVVGGQDQYGGSVELQ
jgi:hypothetical protein